LQICSHSLHQNQSYLCGSRTSYIKDYSSCVHNHITTKVNCKLMSQQPTNNDQHNEKATAAANGVVGNTTHHDESYIEAPEGVLSDYSDVEVEKRDLPEDHKPGSATTPENGGGYSG